MYRFTTYACILTFSFTSIPQAAHAADFGFVRWPGYLDIPIFLTAILTGLFFAFFKTQMPKEAKDFSSIPKEERSAQLKISAFLMLASLVACIGMVFVGMGLQRIAG